MKQSTRGLFAALGLIVFVFACTTAMSAEGRITAPGDYKQTYEHGGRTRSYVLHLPAKAVERAKIPVVLAFHGGGANPKQIRAFAGLDALADKKGFAVVYPAGTGPTRRLLTWNAGRCCAYAWRKKIDDVGAVRALLDDLERRIPVDKRRVFATGASNGGMMAYRLGCQMSDKIAAIAPVIGNLVYDACAPSRPVPLIAFNGTADRMLPFEGGVGEHSITKAVYPPVRDTIRKWSRINGCGGGPIREPIPDKHEDGTKVSTERYTGCRRDADVVLYVVDGGGHTWPGGPGSEWGKFGKCTREISATQLMWEFFEDHPMP